MPHGSARKRETHVEINCHRSVLVSIVTAAIDASRIARLSANLAYRCVMWLLEWPSIF